MAPHSRPSSHSDKGSARAVLKDNRVRSVRIRATADQAESLVVRAINFQLLNDVYGVVRNPNAAIGAGNVAVTKGDTEFAYPIGACTAPVINRDFTLKLSNGGNPYSYSGPISGSGKVEIFAAKNAPLVLDGKAANTMQGTWSVKAGQVVLAKEPGMDAMGGTIIVGGSSDSDSLILGGSNQINDAASLQLLGSEKGSASFNLNGFSETIARLTLAPGTKVLTDGPRGAGVLTVGEAMLDGKSLPKGIYTSSSGWVQGSGYVVVGDVKRVEVSGIINDPTKAIGPLNMAALKSPTTFKLPNGDCTVAAILGDFPLTLVSGGNDVRFNGFITGNGGLRIEAGGNEPLEIAGLSSNSFKGTTTLARGVLKLDKPANAIAIPGNLIVGGSLAENEGDAVIWQADGQIATASIVTLQGTKASYLDLNGHKAAFRNLMMSKPAAIRLGKEGSLRVKQLFVDGKRLKDGVYRCPATVAGRYGERHGRFARGSSWRHWVAGDGNRSRQHRQPDREHQDRLPIRRRRLRHRDQWLHPGTRQRRWQRLRLFRLGFRHGECRVFHGAIVHGLPRCSDASLGHETEHDNGQIPGEEGTSSTRKARGRGCHLRRCDCGRTGFQRLPVLEE